MCFCKHTNGNSLLYSKTTECKHTKTGVIMHHFDLWSVKVADVWWKLQVFRFSGRYETWHCWLQMWLRRQRGRWGSCVGVDGSMFWMHDPFLCTRMADFLSHKSSCFSPLAPLFSGVSLTQRCVRQNAWCCTSLQAASTTLRARLHADCLIEKANKVEVSSKKMKRQHTTTRSNTVGIPVFWRCIGR